MRSALLGAVLALAACSTPENGAPQRVASDEWRQITPAPVRIAGTLFTPTCSQAPGADPAYRFWFRQGAGDGLVVYFDGGGACWDDVTCAVPRRSSDPREADGLYKSELLASDDPAHMRGIFDLANPRNPVRDWSFVFVPYCTGDVHSGSNTASYRHPDTGEPYTIHHRGWDNTQAILQWMRTNVSRPSRLLVTGSSAGAYGAATHYAALRDLFPRGQAIFLGDAGQGVTTPEFFESRNLSWNYRLPASVFGARARLTSDDDVVERLAEHFPRDRFAQYTTSYDVTQRAFYALMGAASQCSSWTDAMVRDLDRRQGRPNFRSYLAAGETHTILRSPLFYAERSGGVPFAEWLAALLSGAALASASCAQCLTPPEECRF